jgi:polyferredoxin
MMDKFKLRKLIQTVFFGFWLLILLLLISGVLNNAHQYCPFASVCFGTMTINGYYTFLISVVIGVLIAILTIFWGRKFCGYICFFGTLQEWIYNLRKAKNKFTQLIPFRLHRILIKLRYLILVFTIITAYLSIQYVYMKFCPVLSLAFPEYIGMAGITTLLIIIVGGFFIERCWCRYLCPYAALMNVFEFVGKFLRIKRAKIFRNIQTSINCFNCANYCPMNIDLGCKEEIEDVNCIQCLRCVRKCSKTGAGKSECIYRD